MMRGRPIRFGLFAIVAVLVMVNALGCTGVRPTMWGDAALQAGTLLLAIACGLATARRHRGAARLWRLLVAATASSWLLAQLLWWWQLLILDTRNPPAPLAVVAYYAFPVLALASLLVLAWVDRQESRGRPNEPWTRYATARIALDGLLATASFSALVWASGEGGSGGFTVARSGGRPVTAAYPVLILFVVVVAIILALGYRAERRHRFNFLLLTAGVVALLASDRLIAYLVAVGADSGRIWVRLGFILGALLMAYAVLKAPSGAFRGEARTARVLDWTQLLLPYLGAVGVTAMFAFHLLIGQRPDRVVIVLAVVVVSLLVARQVVSLAENRSLMRRVCVGQRRLIHQIHHDAVTQLPNRLLFAQRLDEAVTDGAQFVLMYVDLDDFKVINDQFGHAAGDELLRAVGGRLRGCARASDTVARIGGDEFGILLQGELGTPEVCADRFRAALRPPFALHGTSVSVRASMGLVTPDPDEPSLTADALLRRADASMYAGKRMGKDSAVVYGPKANTPVDFPTALRRAEGRAPEGFGLVYQPVVRLPDASPVAIEALARWTARNGTHIPPETFVSAAEAAGLGADLDALVLDIACREVVAAGLELTLHVNVCAARLGCPEFERSVLETLTRHGMAPGQLVIEITETVPIVDLVEGAAAIQRLRAVGVRVALDDFGAGYNTLTYLHALPVDFVKLDRSMTIGIDPNRDAALYVSVMALCRALNLEVVAEGIETDAQSDTIASAGCQFAQGYLFGRPVPIGELTPSGSMAQPRMVR